MLLFLTGVDDSVIINSKNDLVTRVHLLLYVMILTGEGGKLKRNIPLCRGRDFEIIPEPVWRALQQWYGGGPALPRTVTLLLLKLYY